MTDGVLTIQASIGATLVERHQVTNQNVGQRDGPPAPQPLYAAADAEPSGRLGRAAHGRAKEKEGHGDPEHGLSAYQVRHASVQRNHRRGRKQVCAAHPAVAGGTRVERSGNRRQRRGADCLVQRRAERGEGEERGQLGGRRAHPHFFTRTETR